MIVLQAAAALLYGGALAVLYLWARDWWRGRGR